MCFWYSFTLKAVAQQATDETKVLSKEHEAEENKPLKE